MSDQSSTAILPYEPQALTQLDDLSKRFSQSGLIPGNLRGKPGDVFLILLKGHEMGLSPLQSLATIHVIDGRPAPAATLKMALCLRSPVCEYIRCIESTDKLATYEAKRKGSEPVRLTWKIEQAARANLLGKPNWKNWPDAMLRARCESAICTAVFGDLCLGFGDEEEVVDGVVDGIRQDPASDLTPASKTAEVTASLKAQMGSTTASLPPGLKKATVEPTDAAFEPVDAPTTPADTTEVAKALKEAPPQQPVSQMKPTDPAKTAELAAAQAQAAEFAARLEGVAAPAAANPRHLAAEAEKAKAAMEKLGSTDAKKVSAWQRIQELCKEHGKDPKAVVKGLNFAGRPSELTYDHVSQVRDSLEAHVQAPAGKPGPTPGDVPL